MTISYQSMGMVVQETTMNDRIVGLILKQTDYKDASAIVTVLTQQYGKIALVANGIRKPKSKNAGRLCFDYREDRTIFTLQSVSTISTFKNMHMDLGCSMCAAVMSEVCDAFVMQGAAVESKEMYFYLEKAFQYLENHGNVYTILALFLVSVMAQYGITPDVDECVVCSSKYVSAISSREGGFLCANCAQNMKIQTTDIASLKRFRLLVKGGLKQYSLIAEQTQAKKEDIQILVDMIFQHTGIKIRSFALFERLFFDVKQK